MKKRSVFVLVFLFVFSVVGNNTLRANCCGNYSPGGGGGISNPVGDPVVPYTGNEFRDIQDLRIWGGVGKPLVWSRHAGSREVPNSNLFGLGHYWRHSYQWDLAMDGVDSQHRAKMTLITPTGSQWFFTQDSLGVWKSTFSCPGKLFAEGNGFIYQDQDGSVYHFSGYGSGAGAYYLLSDFTDNQNNLFTLQYNSLGQVTRVSEPGGRYLTINYTTVAANQPKFRTLAKVYSAPAPGQWMQLSITNQKYKEHNIVVESADESYGSIAEVQVFERKTGAQLSGKIISSGPKSSATNAFDGNPSTFYQSPMPSGSFVGLQFKKDKQVGQVNILAAAGSESAMVPKGWHLKPLVVKTSRKKPISMSVISSVTTSDGRTVTYQYTPFKRGGLPFTYPTLTAALYGDGTEGTYSYGQDFESMRPLVREFNDVRCTTSQQHSKSVYQNSSTGSVLGFLVKQINPATGGKILSLTNKPGLHHEPQATFANGWRMIERDYTNGVIAWEKGNSGKIHTHYSYDANGFISATKKHHKETTTYVNNAYGSVTQITYPDGSQNSFTYNDFNSPTSHTDAKGNTTSYNRDQNNHITSIGYPDGSSEGFSYNGFGQVVSHSLRNGGSESFSYDNTGLLQKKTDALGNTTSYGYDSAGRMASVTDALGNTTSIQYNDLGLVTLITNPDGSTHSKSYNASGDLISETSEAGGVSSYSYDPTFHLLLSSTDPLGNTTQYGYLPDSSENKPLWVSLPSGKGKIMTYDRDWKLISEQVGTGSEASTTSYSYDRVNNPVKITDGNGNVTTLHYDKRHRKISSTDAMGHITRWSYDAAGDVTSVTAPDGGVTSNSYDKMHRLVETTDAMGNLTQMKYDSAGNMVAMSDPKGNTYKYRYDVLNRRIEMIYPDNTKEKWGYDQVGNMVTYVTRAGQIRTGVFDSRHREIQTTWSDNTPAITRSYDVGGRLLSQGNSASVSTYTYDAASHLLSETQTAAGQPSRTVSYSYDADGNKVTLGYPSGSTMSYGYTSRNQVGSISADGPPPVGIFTYDGAGHRISKRLENGSTTLYSYNAAGQLTGIGNTIAGYSYTLDASGRKLSRSETTPASSQSDQYNYDARGQLLGVTYGTGRKVQYNYDASGNRTSVNDRGTNTLYTANGLNEYTQVGSMLISYDKNGNLTSASTGSYNYDAQNRLTRAQSSSGLVKMQYDARNRVVSRSISGVTTYFVYDDWNLIGEYDASGNELARYVQGPSTDELLARITPAGTTYYHQDGNQNVVALSDAQGHLVESYSYDVYGAPTIKDALGGTISTSSVGNRFLFTGREYVSQMGLYDYRNRVYSAVLGRFLQTDPIRFQAGDANIYRYCGNDPVNGRDPSGLSPSPTFQQVVSGQFFNYSFNLSSNQTTYQISSNGSVNVSIGLEGDPDAGAGDSFDFYVRTTTYSQTENNVDTNTLYGNTSTGTPLSWAGNGKSAPGIAAVDTNIIPYGSIIKTANGSRYIAADTGGDVNNQTANKNGASAVIDFFNNGNGDVPADSNVVVTIAPYTGRIPYINLSLSQKAKYFTTH